MTAHDSPSQPRDNVTHRLCRRNAELEAAVERLGKLEGNSAASILLREILELKELEAQLFQAQKMEAIETLAGGIAHDFNNILQAISGYAQILAMGKTDADPEFRKLEMILRSTQRGCELINRLMIFSRKFESHLLPLNINTGVIHACSFLESAIPNTIRIRMDMEEPIGTINADAAQVEQILVDIAINASKAMPEGGELTVSTRNVFLNDQTGNIHTGIHPGDYILLTISDTGIGIDSDTVAHIFEPFYSRKITGSGTGMGLALVHGIVKNHNGFILCHSEKGQGTTFQIYFPVIKTEGEIPGEAFFLQAV